MNAGHSLRSAAIRLSHVLPLRGLVPLGGPSPLVVAYHVFSDRPLPHIRNLYSNKSAREFEHDLDYLLKIYRPLDLEDLLQALRGERTLRAQSIFFTFDDGLREVYDVAYPLLKRKGVPAAFFISSRFVDNKELFFRFKASLLIEQLDHGRFDEVRLRQAFDERSLPFREYRSALLGVEHADQALLDEIAEVIGLSFEDYLRRHLPFMSSPQVEQLLTDGFFVGGHSVDHPRFQKLGLNQQLAQTRECMAFLGSRFKLARRIFAFPFSDAGVSDAYFARILEEGLVEVFFGTKGFGIDGDRRLVSRVLFDGVMPHTLKRIYLERAVSRGLRRR